MVPFESSIRVRGAVTVRSPSSAQGMCLAFMLMSHMNSVLSGLVGRGTYIAVFLLGYVFAAAKKHWQVSSPSIK